MRAVIRFTKSEEIKYISHLDVLRMFQRALKRAELPVSFSLGFHPHILLSFALAAPVGVSSDAEYAEVMLDYPLFCEEVERKLNNVMPGGCKVLKVFELEEKQPSLMAVVCKADYALSFKKEDVPVVKAYVESLKEQPEIIIMKKTKKGIKPTDIKSMIYDMHFEGDVLKCSLASGGQTNLRPDSIAQLIAQNTDKTAKSTVRTELYITSGNKQVRPEEGEGII